MKHKRQKTTYIAIGLLVFVVAWVVALWLYGPTAIVDVIGAENGYIVMALVSLFGGVSSIGGASYVTTLLTLSSGGLNPFYLALASGIGISVGDTVYFYLGKKGVRSLATDDSAQNDGLKGRVVNWINKLTDWLDAKPKYFTPIATYLIAGFTPTPNDLLTIALGSANRNYVSTITALVLANMTHTYLIARFGEIILFF